MNQVTPSPPFHNKLLIDDMVAEGIEVPIDRVNVFRTDTSLSPLTGKMDEVWPMLRLVLAGLKTLVYQDQANKELLGLPARLELFADFIDAEVFGTAIFDSRQQLIVHIGEAIPRRRDPEAVSFCRRIMRAVDVPESIVQDLIYNLTDDSNVGIVLSREPQSAPDDDLASLHLPEWTWWRVR